MSALGVTTVRHYYCENHATPKARWLMEPTMPLKKDFSDLRLSFEPLTLYQKFEQVCVLMLTTLIAIIIALALWNLTLKILLSIWATNFDPTDYGVFQTVFGMILPSSLHSSSSAPCWWWRSGATVLCKYALSS